jgi:hypothetical protein
MKKLIAYIASICFGLFLTDGSVMAQSGSEIKLDLKKTPLTSNGDQVAVNAIINARQSGNGIRFTVIVKNNSGKAIVLDNIADILSVYLYNESGVDIALHNYGRKIHTDNRNWKFRSKTVVPESVSVNGRADARALRDQEFIEIPAGGETKVNLTLNQVQQVDTSGHASESKPSINLMPGKYKLKLSVAVLSKDVNDPGKILAVFDSPKIDIDYGR